MITVRTHQNPALRAALLFVCGIIAGDTIQLSSLAAMPLLALWAAGEFLLFFMRRTGALLSSLAPAATVILSAALALSLANNKDARVPAEGVRGTILIGEVADPPVTIGSRTRVLVEASLVLGGGSRVPPGTMVAVTITKRRRDTEPLRLDYGSRILLRGDLAFPPRKRNPGMFDTRKFYDANGISLVMVVRGHESVHILRREGGSPLYRDLVLPVREHILRMIDRTVGGEEGEYLKGLLLGVRTGMSREDREAFVNAGVAHILAVSGSNVAAVAATVFFLLGLLRVPHLLRSLLCCAALLYYMVLTGSQPPVVRATIMGLILLIGKMLEEKSNPLNALGAAAIGILMVEPRQLFDVGFQLSFSAVLSLLLLYPRANAVISHLQFRGFFRRPLLWLLRILALSLVASLGTLPVTASTFGRVSLIGLLANVAVVPAAGASVVLGITSAVAQPLSTTLAGSASLVNWLILHFSLVLTREAGNLPFASLETLRFSASMVLPFLALLALAFFSRRGARARALLILTLASCAGAVVIPADEWRERGRRDLRVSFIDVGQGDAILVELPEGRNILIDTGPSSRAYDSGKEIIAPFLKRMGVRTLDAIIVTHRHNDHEGGLHYLMRAFRARRLFIAASDTLRSDVEAPRGGEAILSTPGLRIYVLSPPSWAGARYRAGFSSPRRISQPRFSNRLTRFNTVVRVTRRPRAMASQISATVAPLPPAAHTASMISYCPALRFPCGFSIRICS